MSKSILGKTFLWTFILVFVLAGILITSVAFASEVINFYPVEDGSMYKQSATPATWADIHDAISANATDRTSSVESFGWIRNTDSLTKLIKRSFYIFNTSAIPDDATITSSTLKLFVGDDAHDTCATSTLDLVGATPSYPTLNLNNTDFPQVNTTAFSSITFSALVESQYNNFILNSDGLSFINKTGFTKLATRIGWDRINTFPTNYFCFNPPGSGQAAEVYTNGFFSEVGATSTPVLSITYTEPTDSVQIDFPLNSTSSTYIFDYFKLSANLASSGATSSLSFAVAYTTSTAPFCLGCYNSGLTHTTSGNFNSRYFSTSTNDWVYTPQSVWSGISLSAFGNLVKGETYFAYAGICSGGNCGDSNALATSSIIQFSLTTGMWINGVFYDTWQQVQALTSTSTPSNTTSSVWSAISQFLFDPDPNVVSSFKEVQTFLLNLPPFSYLGLVKSQLENVSISATSSPSASFDVNFGNGSTTLGFFNLTYTNNLFGGALSIFKTFCSVVVYLLLVDYIIIRLRSIFQA